ncbi:G-protein coupled receptor 35-like [Tiliqua scincoides]|uniref:G-protein coupled receptor 35-like n=1 Tax=Tiliqua scincoides TaxID=71010 RepID=UPI003463351F
MSDDDNQTIQHFYSTGVNCSQKIKIDANTNIFEIIVTFPVTLFGGLFNVIALWVFCCRMRKWTETRIYMVNLAMADFTIVFTLPFITYFHYSAWPKDYFCKVVSAIYCINMPMSNSLVTLIALDRYIAIKHPLKAKALRSPQKAIIISLFLWLLYVLFPLMAQVIRSNNDQEYCFYPTTEYSLSFLFYILVFFISLLILIFCSTQIIRCLKEKQNTSLREEKLTRKALCIISVNMGAFIVCFLPFNLSLLVRYGADAAGVDCFVRNAVNKAVFIALCISHLNCCLDAICYYLVAKEFQEAASFLPRFQLKQSRSNFTQDSQLQS